MKYFDAGHVQSWAKTNVAWCCMVVLPRLLQFELLYVHANRQDSNVFISSW